MGWTSCAPTSRTRRTTRRGSTSWRRAAGRARPATMPNLMTTFVFRVRNVPAALYKALGGFATNGVNMTKLESYMLGGHFAATQFLCDVDGHPEQPPLRRALEELAFFSSEVRVLGVYPAAAFRLTQGARPAARGDPSRRAIVAVWRFPRKFRLAKCRTTMPGTSLDPCLGAGRSTRNHAPPSSALSLIRGAVSVASASGVLAKPITRPTMRGVRRSPRPTAYCQAAVSSVSATVAAFIHTLRQPRHHVQPTRAWRSARRIARGERSRDSRAARRRAYPLHIGGCAARAARA